MFSKSQTWRTVLSLAALAFVVASGTAYSLPKIGAEEVTLGRDAVKQAEKNIKLLDDPAISARVQAIGQALAKVANTVQTPSSYGSDAVSQFTYTFKVVDDDDVNAFSLPGGHVYVYRGAIKLCESDHELAAVISHEIAHAAHHHMVYLMREQSKLDSRCALVLLATMLGRAKSEDMTNVMMGAQFYKLSKVNGQSQLAELDADQTGLVYMTGAGYNPVGMLTFLERLARNSSMMDWGILETHPQSADRAIAVKNQLARLKVDINRRAVEPSLGAQVKALTDSPSPAYEVTVGDVTVCKLANEEEAHRTADKINELLDGGVQIRELKSDGANVLARGEPILSVGDPDAVLSNKPASEVAYDAHEALRRVLFKQMVQDMW